MTAIIPPSAEEFYKAHLAMQKDYVHVYVAREVKTGEIDGGVPVTRDGYSLRSENFYRTIVDFIPADEFAAAVTPAGNLALPFAKKDLATNEFQDLLPVPDGEKITLGTAGKETTIAAPGDGFTFSKNGTRDFMNNNEMMSQFNYAGSHFERHKEVLVTLNGEKPVTGILFSKEQTLRDVDGASTIYPAGTLLYCLDGHYYFEKMPHSANATLRLTEPDYHQRAIDNQDDLRNIWLKKKAQKAPAAA